MATTTSSMYANGNTNHHPHASSNSNGCDRSSNGGPAAVAYPQHPPPQHLMSGDLSSGRPLSFQSEGWLELFLTPSEKLTFSQWTEVVQDQSLVHTQTSPFFQRIATLLPVKLAPNLVTLTGCLTLFQAWYLTNTYPEQHRIAVTWIAWCSILLFFVLNSITVYHADLIRQHTSLSDLFKYSCDMGSTIWLSMLTTRLLLLNNLTSMHTFDDVNADQKAAADALLIETQWYAVQASQLVLLLKHLSAYKRHEGLRYRGGAGPGEVLLTCLVVLAVEATMGWQVVGTNLWQHVSSYFTLLLEHLPFLDNSTNDYGGDLKIATLSVPQVIQTTYYVLLATAVLQSLFLTDPKHAWTRFGLVTSLLLRMVPAMLLPIGDTIPIMDVICDGFFLTVVTTDLVVAKMAGRQLHPWVVCMSLAAATSYTTILVLVAVYYIAVFCDLSSYLNLPLLATCRNVYCDGVYDLCHIGHKRAFQNALQLGNRLYVGIMSDEDASHYKRPPIMTHAERCQEVQACKAVTKVIPNAPCFGLTNEFLLQHNIHVVAFGEEYLERYPDPKDDPYYGVPRQLGMAIPLPRTNTLSTTDLIKRIQKASDLEKKSPT